MKPNMYCKLCGVLSLTLLVTALSAQVKIGDNPGILSSSAVLELEKTNMGLLITRISLADVWDQTTILNPADGLLVYNTNFGEPPDPVNPGFYYWREDEERWIRLLTESGSSGGDVWIDDNNNILSANSANQSLSGYNNVVLGENAFADPYGPTDNVIAIGLNAAYANSGFEVNAFGPVSCEYNTGDVVNAMGLQSAQNNYGNDVNAFGVRAGQNNGENGDNLNAMGIEAAQYNLGADVNAFGYMAAQSNLVGTADPDPLGAVNALGAHSAQSNKGSIVNALGPAAGEQNTGWSVNFLGSQSGQHNTGSEVNAMGAMAAQHNTIACVNALGLEAARYNTGYGTNAFGYWAARNNDGNHAVAIGDQALVGDESAFDEGEGNIGIGYHAGMNVGTGYRNICIGFDTPIPNPFANDQINIGNRIIRDENGVIQLKDFIRLTPLESAPSYTEEGTIYYDGTEHKLKVMTDAGWVDLH